MLISTGVVEHGASEAYDHILYDAIADFIVKENDVKAAIANLQEDYRYSVVQKESEDRFDYDSDLLSAREKRDQAIATAANERAIKEAEVERDYGYALIDAEYDRNKSVYDTAHSLTNTWATKETTLWKTYQLNIATAQRDYSVKINDLVKIRERAKVLANFEAAENVAGKTLDYDNAVVMANKILGTEASEADRDRKDDHALENKKREQDIANAWKDRQNKYANAQRDFSKRRSSILHRNNLKQLIAAEQHHTATATQDAAGWTPTDGWLSNYVLADFPDQDSPGNGQQGQSPYTVIYDTTALKDAYDARLSTRSAAIYRHEKIQNVYNNHSLASSRITANEEWRLESNRIMHDALSVESAGSSAGHYSVEYEYHSRLADARHDRNVSITTEIGELEIAIAKNTPKPNSRN